MSDTTEDEGYEPYDGPKLSFSELVSSLTGYEENEISERFGDQIGFLMRTSLTKAGRALIYVTERRNGRKPTPAFDRAMKLKISEVNDRFLDDDEDQDDFDPDDPDTEKGKDDSPSE